MYSDGAFLLFQFSSTSSDDSSSCSESGPFRPRMRVGVRMGTYGAYSDPDYTSSSEQSCDTVIYVGPGGQALSDRELTDNEGPPSVVPVLPRGGSLPRPSKLANPAYQYPVSNDGYMHAEHGAAKQPRTMPKCGANTVANSRQSKGGSPSRQFQPQQGPTGAGVVQLPRKLNVKSKPLQHARMEQQDACWYREGPVGEATPGAEQWVDGPGAPESRAPHEQWIDGPTMVPMQQAWGNESYVYNGEGKPIALSSMNASGLVKDSGSGEQWVDGPREFQGEELRRTPHGSPHKMIKPEKAHKMWKQMSGKPLPPPRACSLENWTPQYKSQVPHRDDRDYHRESSRERHRDRRPRDLEQPKSGQLRNPHVHSISTSDSRTGSHHGSSGDSPNSSMMAQVSRPTSVDNMESDPARKDVTADSTLPTAPVKSFVRDWVEKHSVEPTDHSPHHSPHGSRHSSPRHHKPKEVKNPAVTSVAHSGDNNAVVSGGDSAHSSPKSSKKHKQKRTALPGSESRQTRITQWVQEVQEATSDSKDTPFSPNSEAGDEHPAPECDQGMLQENKPSDPPAYEECVDMDEDIPDVEQQYLDAEKVALEPETGVTDEIIKDSRETDSKPLLITEVDEKQAFTKGLDDVEKSSTVESQVNEADVPNQPDSLYEMDIDDQFEAIEQDSKLNSTFTSEDDAGSNVASLPVKDIDAALSESPLTVAVQDSLQASHAASDEGVAEETVAPPPVVEPDGAPPPPEVTAELIVHAAQLSPLSVNAEVDSGNASAHSGEHLSPPSSDDSDKMATRGRSLCRPSCLRRPDGASNPNLALVEQTLKEKSEELEEQLEKSPGLSSPVPAVLPKPLYSSTPSTTSKVCHATAGDISPIPKRSIPGQSSENIVTAELIVEASAKLISKIPTTSPPLSGKDTKQKEKVKDSKEKSKFKPSILPKPLSRKSKSADRAESVSVSPSKLIPSRFSSKSSTSSKSSKSSAGSASPIKSSSSSRKSEKHSGKHVKSSSPSPSSRPSSVKSAPSRFSSPFFSRLPTSSPSKSSKSQVTSPTNASNSKDSRSKIKSPSCGKKETKGSNKSGVMSSPTGKVPGLPPPSSRGTDSDSGNDSGIVKNDKSKRLLSPYSTVTNPRVSTHSSSGHGSDFSTSSAQQVLEKNTKLLQQKEAAHLSSGYESMVGPDGEATTSSGTQDSTSESSAGGGRTHGNKVLKKKPPICTGELRVEPPDK